MATPFTFETWPTPDAAGVSSAGLGKFLDACARSRDKVQFHSLILLRHGKIAWKMNVSPYDDHTPHMLYSLSKSFTSAAAGFAVSEGLLSWDSSVVDVLPDEIPAGREDDLRPITLEALLCMGSGLDEASDSPSPSPDVTWARHVLSHQVKHPPMTHFHYNSFGTYLVSCMVQKVTGQTVRDYLIPRLWEPLGIEKPDWDCSPEGINCGGFGLHLRTDDIARFGQCLLEHGMWQGRRVLPEGWVERATSEHIANYQGSREDGNEWGQGYGYQFWRCIGGRYRGDGAFGQICMIDEARDAVLAVTCGAPDMGEEFRLIREYLFPAFDAPDGEADLTEKIKALYYTFPADDGTDRPLPEGRFEAEVGGQRFGVSLRRSILDQIELTLTSGRRGAVRFSLPRERAALIGTVPCGRSTLRFFGAYGWQRGALRVGLRTPDAPDALDGAFTWDGDTLTFEGVGVSLPGGTVVFRRA